VDVTEATTRGAVPKHDNPGMALHSGVMNTMDTTPSK